MTENEARLQLLLRELDAIQSAIQRHGTSAMQIKGWSVTVASATALAAATTGYAALPLVGVVAMVIFWLIDAHFKSVERVFGDRDQEIEEVLSKHDVATAFDQKMLVVPGLASCFLNPEEVKTFWDEVRYESSLLWKEARLPLVFNVYLLLTVLLLATAFGMAIA